MLNQKARSPKDSTGSVCAGDPIEGVDLSCWQSSGNGCSQTGPFRTHRERPGGIGIQTLKEMCIEYKKKNLLLLLANMKGSIRSIASRSKLIDFLMQDDVIKSIIFYPVDFVFRRVLNRQRNL